MKLSNQEEKLFRYLLDLATEKLGNSSCNDIPQELFEGLDLDQLTLEFHQYNNSIGDTFPFINLGDYAVFDFLANKILK